MCAAANAPLTAHLNHLGWSPGRLARALNDLLGSGHVSRSTVVGWVNYGRVPRDPLPTITAHVLTEALGRPVPLTEVWGPQIRPSTTCARADDGLPDPTDPGATVDIATQWSHHDGGDMKRRTFLAVSGAAALSSPALTTTATARATDQTAGRTLPTVTPAIAATIATTVDAIRNLDDVAGGDPSTLRHAHGQFALVADHVRADRYTDTATRTRTINLWAQLAQTIGWMATDAGMHGYAQRYLRTGLIAAHDSQDTALAAHLHGCLSYEALTRGHIGDAIEQANLALDTSRSAPPAVRALAAARHAHAHAALGDLHGLRQSTEEAMRHLDRPDALDTRPPWLYWLTDLHVVTGQSLITAAFADQMHPRRSASLLTEADPLITDWLGTHAERSDDRDALLHGAWLARSYLRRDDLEQTLATTESLLRCAATVGSVQARRILRELDSDLANRTDLHNHRSVRHLRTTLHNHTV